MQSVRNTVVFISVFFGVFLVLHTPASAHVPLVVSPQTVADIIPIEDPELSQAFYGTLDNFPHTYEIRATEPFTLSTMILVPDIEESTNVISGIIIKEQKRGTRVLQVARLHARDAAWESDFEPFGGDSYRMGPSFETQLDAGVYRVEVHTPDNKEKYVLVVGSREEMTLGYFELLGRMIEVKHFFGKSSFMIVQSMFVYVPLLGIAAIGLLVWYIRKRKYRSV